MNLQLVTEVFAFSAFLALVVERLAEQFISPLAVRFNIKWLMPYAGLVLGTAGSVAFNIDLLSPLAESVGLQPAVSWVGVALSGLMVGGGSNLLHDLWPQRVKG